MLPDFICGVTIDGRPERVLCRDVPVSVFFHGYPFRSPDTDGYIADRDAWMHGLLERAVIRPRLTPEALLRLGPVTLLELERAYLAAVGCGSPDAGAIEAFWDGPILPPPASWAPALSTPVPTELLGAVMGLAEMFHVLPAAVWLLPISEYMRTQQVVVDARRGAGPAKGLSPLEGQVGMEGAD